MTDTTIASMQKIFRRATNFPFFWPLHFFVDKASSIWINVEVIDDREFIGSIQEQNGVWVLMADQSFYALPTVSGRDLPVWASAEKAEAYAENLNQRGLSPMLIPMISFLSAL